VPATIYLPGLLQIKPQYDYDADTGHAPENVLWYLSATHTTPSLANLQAIQNIFDPKWGAVWDPLGVSTHHYNGSIITDYSSNTGLSWNSVGTFTPHAGTAGGSPGPPQLAALISLHVPVRYRGGHPRIYIPQISMGVVSGTANDTILSSVTAAVATAYNTLLTSMTGSGVLGGQTSVAYLHRTDSTLANPQPYPSFTVQGLVATQRRRVRKVAHH
jgi:hypothetical protein